MARIEGGYWLVSILEVGLSITAVDTYVVQYTVHSVWPYVTYI